MSNCIHVLQQTLHAWDTQTKLLLSKTIYSLINHDVGWFSFLCRSSQLHLSNSPFNAAFLFSQELLELERVWTTSSKLSVYGVMVTLTNVGRSIFLAIAIPNLAVERNILTNVRICNIIVHCVFFNNIAAFSQITRFP
jgi:hypothetical protein